ncbi:hypothetical protein C8J55DRAFT_71488 [Lentinula edodes]|uniref:Uncharacterized protein n=1 Tax=Lentinula lateritia TaxID=40482 RepID=A0A9W9AC87_9AGAR|nr:hypothetical protein C8J55DRAFT_71488 [Lentinula edodes]
MNPCGSETLSCTASRNALCILYKKNEIRKSATRHPAKGMSLPKERVVRSHPDNVPKGGLPVPLPREEPPRRIIPRGNDSETLQCPEAGRVLICVDQALAGTGISVRQAISSRCVDVIGNASELVGSSEQLVRLVASPPNTQPLARCLSRVPRCKLDNAGPVGIGRPSQGALVPSNVVAERAECSRLDNPCRELFIELFSGLFSRHDLSNEFYFHFAWGLYTGENPVEDVSKRVIIHKPCLQALKSDRRIRYGADTLGRNPHYLELTMKPEKNLRQRVIGAMNVEDFC